MESRSLSVIDTPNPKASFAWLPIVRITGDRRKPLEYQTELTLHWCRFLWIVVFSVSFYFTIACTQSNAAVMSGELSTLLGEVFPDQAMTGERMTKSEIANAWDQQMDGDSVSKILNWFQAFCMYKRGSDEHVTWAWSCNIGAIKLGKLHPVPWDVVHDSIPYNASEESDFVNHICSPKFVLQHIVFGDDPRKVPFGDVEALQKEITKDAQQNEKLDENTRRNIVGKVFEPVWDEWAVLDGNPMLNIIKKGVNDQLDEREAAKKQATEASLHQSSSARRHGNVSSLMEAHSEVLGRALAHHQPSQNRSSGHDVHDHQFGINHDQEFALAICGALGKHQPSQFAPTIFDKLQPEAKLPGAAFSEMSMHHKDPDKEVAGTPETGHADSELISELDYGDDELHAGLAGMPDFCFNRFAPSIKKIMEMWRNLGMSSMDRELTLDEFDWLLKNMHLTKELREDLVVKADADKSGSLSYSEVLQAVKNNRKSFWWHDGSLRNDKGLLFSTCRNHHWGMIHLCGPESFSVEYRVERGNSELKQSSLGKRYRRDFVDIEFNYKQVGYDPSDPTSAATGWYEATIDTKVHKITLGVGWLDLALAVFNLLLFASLFLVELLWTVLRWPYTIYELLMPAKRAEVTKLIEVKERLARLVDGRGVRPHFMSTPLIVMEHVAALVFLMAMIYSAIDANQPSMRMEGAKMPNTQCRDVFEKKVVDWFDQEREQTGKEYAETIVGQGNGFDFITPLEYIWYCTSPEEDGINQFAEAFFRLLFIGDAPFGLAIFVVAFRLLDIVNVSGGTKWLTDTLELSAEKIMYFMGFYWIVIFLFAILLKVTFGEIFPQYHTVNRACYVLTLFTFGTTELAWEGVRTFEHDQSCWLTTYLLVFSVTIVSIAMQFFTTIILDAYSIVMNPDRFLEYQQQQKVGAMVRVVAHHMFPQVSKAQTNVLPQFRKSDERLVRGLVLTDFLQGVPPPPGTAAEAEAIGEEQTALQGGSA